MSQRNYGDIAIASMQDELEKIAAKERYLVGKAFEAFRKKFLPQSGRLSAASKSLEARLSQPTTYSEQMGQQVAKKLRAGDRAPVSPVVDTVRKGQNFLADMVGGVAQDPVPSLLSLFVPGAPVQVPALVVRAGMARVLSRLAGESPEEARRFADRLRRSPSIPRNAPLIGDRFGPRGEPKTPKLVDDAPSEMLPALPALPGPPSLRRRRPARSRFYRGSVKSKK